MSAPCDLAVVGAGLAGMSAALFAVSRGLRTVQVGNAGALLFSSGLLDLMGVHPIAEGRIWSDPWAAVAAVRRDLPDHPYARVATPDIRAAFREMVAALGEAGLAYAPPGDANCEVVTGVGTVKSSYCVPQTMLPGAAALAARTPCLLVDFHGLREFSARQIAETLRPRWPALRAARVQFSVGAAAGETYTAHLARALELREHRAALCELIRPHLRTAQAVGLPAVLGIRRTEVIAADLAAALGVPVFEIPTLPTSVPGLRLKEALERAVAARGVRRLVQHRVVAVVPEAEVFTLHLDDEVSAAPPLKARAVVLATGRFMGHGLVADRGQVREALMGLPVVQPASRVEWHRVDLFDRRGHPLNQAGVEIDDACRPRDELGRPVHQRLFAAGTVLAHHDWARMKCGAGIAIATAFAAVAAVAATVPARGAAAADPDAHAGTDAGAHAGTDAGAHAGTDAGACPGEAPS
jgi:glycerol-3-phosphate dehydrogenase subunit B